MQSKAGVVKEAKYQYHQGSIRVSGRCQAFKTGLSAAQEWKKGTRPVEFVFFGGNAGHQAFKACVIARREIEKTTTQKVMFVPEWDTVLSDPSETEPVGIVKDISIWRIVEIKAS